MKLPSNSIPLAFRDEELILTNGGSHAVMTLDRNASESLMETLINLDSKAVQDRLYVTLGNIRGTNDSTILSVFVNSSSERANDDRFVGSIGLYGLRRASVAQHNTDEVGITHTSDVTNTMLDLFRSKHDPMNEFNVILAATPELPDSTRIKVGWIAMYIQRSTV